MGESVEIAMLTCSFHSVIVKSFLYMYVGHLILFVGHLISCISWVGKSMNLKAKRNVDLI